jgi:iron(III) transport system substrate-binding protein
MMGTTRGACRIALASALVWIGLMGSASGQAKPEDQVVVYSAADADMVNSMVAAFQQKYPAVKVSTVVAGTGEIIKRVEAEAARPLGDVIWSVGPESLGAKKNLLAPYESREAAAFYPGLGPPDKLWSPFTVMPYIIMYNKKLVPDAEAPKAWKDAIDPSGRGRLRMPTRPSRARHTPCS